MRLPKPYYKTNLGAAYLGDSAKLMSILPAGSIDLVVTSPPFALKRKKDYGNVEDREYLDWFRPFATQIRRVLKQRGSLVIDIGGTWVRGQPTRSLYHFELLIMLCEDFGFHLAQEFYWLNPARLPSPAEWVTVRRLRVKDAVDPVWWLSKSPNPVADNRRVLVEYSASMRDLLAKGYKAKLRPSGHDISTNFNKDNNGAIPSNLLEIANTESNSRYLALCRENNLKPHPARYPRRLPEFFIKFLTASEDAVILDPFAGSNVTGEAAEVLGRRWIAFEISGEYLESSRFRFAGELRPAASGVTERPSRKAVKRSPARGDKRQMILPAP